VSAFPPESDIWACPSAGCPYPAELLSGNESPPRFARRRPESPGKSAPYSGKWSSDPNTPSATRLCGSGFGIGTPARASGPTLRREDRACSDGTT